MAPYAVTKAAANALTRKLAAAPPKVRVNAVDPGLTATAPGTETMGSRPVAEGAASVAWAATLGPDGRTVGFFRDGTLTRGDIPASAPVPWVSCTSPPGREDRRETTAGSQEKSMEYTRLGNSGLKVSRIALGCMSFGDTSRGFSNWALDDDAAEPIFRQAVELGITFWDTANVYSHGSSEEIVGRAIRKYTRREDVVLATKVFFPMHDGPGGSGLSRKAILEQIDASLTRLGTDHVDLYQIHRFDPGTPVEETMEALDDVVRSGKARYIGASSMWAWQFSKMQYTADLGGWTRFVSMQNQYSLLQREEEREMFGLLDDQGVGSIPWSPLAKGRLARPWGTATQRSENDAMGKRYVDDANPPIVEAVQKVAEGRGVPMAQVALAWVLHNPVVTAPIVGPTKEHHLADAVAALDVSLTDEEVAALEAPYTPRLPSGYA
jgi:1-deoxyxylulose-5-phosphate synthase